MPKRYHQSHKDRMHESKGVKRSVAHEDEYSMRHNTGGYLTEDHSQVANLPQHVIYRPYGDPVPYLDQHQDDTISGIDHQRSLDMAKARAHFNPRKV